ncbi:MAG: LecA/PA-IL family lectin, partial [Pyrinomonadaceae bacterium]
VAVGGISVMGQEPTIVRCLPADVREIRVPKAEVVTDERGESVYKIKANETWRRTDIEVKRGQKIEITATGIIRWAQDGSAWTIVTPDGTRPPHASHFPHPDAGIGSLVMRIGKATYPAGSNTTIESEDEGPIEFMINDDILTDNSGHFLVKLAVRPY